MRILLTSWLLISSMCSQAETVDAYHYQSFWLWAGVKPQPVLKQASTVYLLQGEITQRRGQAVFLRQGYPPSKLTIPELWLVYRVSSLTWTAGIQRRILSHCHHWQKKGNQVQGIQIDFDAASYHLEKYSNFLRRLRTDLPAIYRLSVTGLLDWAKTGDVRQLNALNGVVDEVIIQSYQGRHSVTNYADYLPALQQLRLPFKIGLVQHGQWDQEWERKLSVSPYYRGAVVFLLNPTSP